MLLMQDPDKHAAQAFVRLSKKLRNWGLHAPEVYAHTPDFSAVLVQDLGNTTFKTALIDTKDAYPAPAMLWESAFAILARLAQQSYSFCTPKERAAEDKEALGIGSLDIPFLLDEVDVFLEWGLLLLQCPLTPTEHQSIRQLWEAFLKPIENSDHGCVLAMRDVHMENLMLTVQSSENSAVNKTQDWSCGVIDFQDALWTHPAYDWVSLIQDVRIPVDWEKAQQHRKHGAALLKDALPHAETIMQAPFTIFALQRSVKIFGIFARLALRDNNKRMLCYLPSVTRWIHFNALQNDVPTPLKQWLTKLPFHTIHTNTP